VLDGLIVASGDINTLGDLSGFVSSFFPPADVAPPPYTPAPPTASDLAALAPPDDSTSPAFIAQTLNEALELSALTAEELAEFGETSARSDARSAGSDALSTGRDAGVGADDGAVHRRGGG
jgi:hypothetical protein